MGAKAAASESVEAPSVEKLLRGAVLFASIAYLALYVVVAAMRARYPFELEWMEGGVLDHVRWMREGNKIYVAPTVDFVPFIYTPLYYYVGYLSSFVFGQTLFAMRIVSILASVGAFFLLYDLARRESGGKHEVGLFAAGLFAATYRKGGEFLDIARVDSLFLFLCLLGIWLVRHRTSVLGRVVAGVVFTLAFLTKQSALIVAAPIALHLVVAERKRALPFVVAWVGSFALSVAVLDAIHGGWFRYYCFELPQKHATESSMWIGFWTWDMASMIVAAVGTIAYFALTPASPTRRLFLAATAGMMLAAWSARLHTGGWHNVLIPALAWLSLGGALGLDRALTTIASKRASQEPPRDAGSDEDASSKSAAKKELSEASRAASVVWAGALVQLGSLYYDPRPIVPRARDAQEGRALVQSLAWVKDLYVPSHTIFNTMLGKPVHAHEMAVEDVLRADHGDNAMTLLATIRAAMAAHRFDVIMVDNDYFAPDIARSYVKQREPIKTPDVFYCVSGIHIRPAAIWVPFGR